MLRGRSGRCLTLEWSSAVTVLNRVNLQECNPLNENQRFTLRATGDLTYGTRGYNIKARNGNCLGLVLNSDHTIWPNDFVDVRVQRCSPDSLMVRGSVASVSYGANVFLQNLTFQGWNGYVLSDPYKLGLSPRDSRNWWPTGRAHFQQSTDAWDGSWTVVRP